LPFNVSEHPYQPYTVPHVVAQVQLLAFAALAFVFLIKFRLYPAEERATNLDTDWFYRRLAPKVVSVMGAAIAGVDKRVRSLTIAMLKWMQARLQTTFSEKGKLGNAWSTNAMAFWATFMLVVALLLNYLNMTR
jgi:multicomponent Na+:H+ antiporter subunit D